MKMQNTDFIQNGIEVTSDFNECQIPFFMLPRH